MSQKTSLLRLISFYLCMVIILGFCSGRFYGSFEPCTFSYSYTDPNCTLFSFDDCEWTECVSYYTCGNDTCCAQYQTFHNSNWDFCSDRCCSESLPLAYNSLQQCEERVKSKVLKIITIVCSVIGGIIVIIVAVCLFCKYGDRCA